MIIKNKSGVTITSLVITIIVIIILGSGTIALFKDGGIIDNAKANALKTDLTIFNEEFRQKVKIKEIEDIEYDKTTINAQYIEDQSIIDETNILYWVPSFKNKYKYVIGIENGEFFIINDSLSLSEMQAARDINIQVYGTTQFDSTTDNIHNAKAGYLYNYKIYGNSIQNGISNPSEPVDVYSLGEPRPNIFDKDNAEYIDNISYSTSTLEFIAYENVRLYYISIKPNTTYTLSKSVASYIRLCSSPNIPVIGEKPTATLTRDINTTTNLTIVTRANDNYLIFQPKAKTEAATWENAISSIEIAESKVSINETNQNCINITSNNKNIFNNQWQAGWRDTKKGMINDDAYSKRQRTVGVTPVKPGETYTLTYSTLQKGSSATYMYYFQYDKYMNFISAMIWYSSNSKTLDDNTYYLTFGLYNPDSTFNLVAPEWMQLEEGTKGTSYVEYKEPVTTTIDLTGHEPLRKIGDVADYIDYENGEIVRNIGKVVFDSNIFACTEYNQYYYYRMERLNAKKGQTVLCTHCDSKYSYSSETPIVFVSGEPIMYFVGWKTLYTTQASFNAFLKDEYDNGRAVTVYYPLEKEQYEKITLPKIQLLEGNGSLSVSDGNINESRIEGSYYSIIEE